ncbi:MAG: 50S ribosomal protein L15, partial [Candidatus Wildermuthbacteria bacterium]|nr:50S ribosomal protein L15 [Candidatus Wildermuthbacteria bacterium]
MQIHELKRTSNAKTKKRVGRGGKKGTYSGRGGKGQTARAGSKVKPLIRELIKRYPKARGTRAQIRRDFVMIVQTKDLERA